LYKNDGIKMSVHEMTVNEMIVDKRHVEMTLYETTVDKKHVVMTVNEMTVVENDCK